VEWQSSVFGREVGNSLAWAWWARGDSQNFDISRNEYAAFDIMLSIAEEDSPQNNVLFRSKRMPDDT
jgi:hypothetical protein